MNQRLLFTALCAFLSCISLATAQRAPGGSSCPNRGTKWVDPRWVGSDQGVTCSGGIGFSFGGVTYTVADSRCPSSVDKIEGHFEADTNTYKYCTYWYQRGTYDVETTRYSCVFYIPPFGCGTLGLGQCCEPSGAPRVTGTFPNFSEDRCIPCGTQRE